MYYNYSGFKVNSLKLKGHKIFGDFEISFVDGDDIEKLTENPKSPYISLLIGSNGTGKSYLLRLIIDIVFDLETFRENGENAKFKTSQFRINYTVDGFNYILTTLKELEDFEDEEIVFPDDKKNIRFYKNGVREANYSQVQLPKKLLASSIMLTDRFPASQPFQFYNYLGVRNLTSNSVAGTRTYIKRIVDCVADNIDKPKFISKLESMLSFLEYDKAFYISYTPKRKHIFFKGNLTLEKFEHFFENYTEYTKITTSYIPWYKNRYDTIKKDKVLLNKLVDECNMISKELDTIEDKKFSKYFEFNVFENSELKSRIKKLAELNRLDIISSPSVSVQKNGRWFEISDSSSGESHFLSNMTAIASLIEDNSLVLIDEPEVSLHPNWQMRYFNFIYNNFSEFSSCQFIITSHSHFLVSDLKGGFSKIIGLKRVMNEIKTIELPSNTDTYGWSAENVLYDIFNLRTTRNFYFEVDLNRLIMLINSQSKDYETIRNLYKKFEKLKYSEFDPMQILLIKTNEYLLANDKH
ncbi:MAG: hypothetical protein RJA07_1829 [Bacteroidota bacterium]|jgi:predicted ATPase